MGKRCGVHKISTVLAVVGGINWGLVGLGQLIGGADWNIVHLVLGSMPTIESVIYVLVGISAVVLCFGCKCKKCMAAGASMGGSMPSSNM